MDHTINLEVAAGHFAQPLYRFAYGLTRNEAEAWNLTQQTFLSLAQHGRRLRGSDELQGWLFTTLRREFWRLARRQSRYPEVAFPPGPHDAGIDEPVTGRDARAVLEALDAVEPAYREALQLFYLAGLSCREIAQALEVPLGTAVSRLARGKEQLRARLIPLAAPTSPNRDPEYTDFLARPNLD
ncbi:MAG: sigma-70 family RNA polymerase sigma factor [Verrucomicrobia bacterium]|nr:sigma-70 family RNA polymerase sigma factor [Verrucomicrobiota bacterium]